MAWSALRSAAPVIDAAFVDLDVDRRIRRGIEHRYHLVLVDHLIGVIVDLIEVDDRGGARRSVHERTDPAEDPRRSRRATDAGHRLAIERNTGGQVVDGDGSHDASP